VAAIDRIRWQALQCAVSPALSLPGRERRLVSYVRLILAIDAVTERLRAAALPPGAIVGLQLQDSLLHVVVTLALEQLGLASVALPARGLPEQFELAAIVSENAIQGAPCRTFQVDHRWMQGGTLRHDNPDPQPAPDAICRIILTSGTTGRPKAVAFTYAMIEERMNSYRYAFGPKFARQSRLLCCMGFGASLGYLFMHYALEQGCMFCIPDQSIDVTCRKLALYGMDTLIASPSTLAEMLNYFGTEGTFAQIGLVLTAGSQLSTSLSERIRRDICNELVVFYGTTEAGVIASAHVDALDLRAGEVGYVAPGMIVDVSDLKDGTRTTQGAGRIGIRSAANATRYLGDEEESREKFSAGWFFPGDLGVFVEGGVLAIKGREAGVINLGGHKTTIETIEGHLQQSPLVRDAAAVVAPDELGIDRITAVLVTAENWSEEQFWSHCKGQVDQQLWPARVMRLSALPRLPNGKLDRAAIREAVSK
jgi:acyl-coenzyme A synthetase/AMP-(fatty) acid ligase